MSTITTDDVHHLAQLSSLQLSDSEVENLRADLENIINHINQLNEVDTSGVEPTYQLKSLEDTVSIEQLSGAGRGSGKLSKQCC